MPNVRILYLREVIKQKSLFSYLNRIRPAIAPLLQNEPTNGLSHRFRGAISITGLMD